MMHALYIFISVVAAIFIILICRKYKSSLILEDPQHKFWDIIIKAVSAVLTVGTIIISAITFLNNQSISFEQKEREFRKEIATRQLNYYSEISEAASIFLVIASYPDSLFTPSYYLKKDKYEQLYYGKMNLVESSDVDKEIHNLSVAIEKFEVGDESVDIHTLRIGAFQLNTACRNSIRKTWGVQLDSLNQITK